MQFEKEDVGYCRRLSGVRGSALLAEREGAKKESNNECNVVLKCFY